MKPSLQLKLTQQLNLTPQLQQSIRLLQLSTVELSQEIERIIQENPLLEVAENWDTKPFEHESENDTQSNTTPPEKNEQHSDHHDPDLDNWFENGDTSFTNQNNEYEIPQMAAEPISLRNYLNQQISLISQISQKEKIIMNLLVDSLNDDGYLTQDLDELQTLIPSELGIEINDLERALDGLQQLDPPGIGARSLQECLLLQLNRLPDDTTHKKKAIRVVTQYLEPLASRDYTFIKRLLKCDDQSLHSIQKLILNLNPKPGSDFNPTNTRYVIPDIIVSKINGLWMASLNNSALPRLSINHLYARILKQKHDESSLSLSSQLNEAKWLIKNLQQRSNTILKVSNAIVEKQQQFFEQGEIAMKPLKLREIAETLELHESTVSRVTTQKFMHTPRGIFELKYFFGSHVSTDSGGTCSAIAIRALVKQLIQNENPKKPLSDNKIANLIEEQGIVVARRTIAKYRESMQIPPANLRKTI